MKKYFEIKNRNLGIRRWILMNDKFLSRSISFICYSSHLGQFFSRLSLITMFLIAQQHSCSSFATHFLTPQTMSDKTPQRTEVPCEPRRGRRVRRHPLAKSPSESYPPSRRIETRSTRDGVRRWSVSRPPSWWGYMILCHSESLAVSQWSVTIFRRASIRSRASWIVSSFVAGRFR